MTAEQAIENQDKMIVFFDNLSRTIFGEVVEEDDTFIKIKNPVIVHVGPSPQDPNKIALQLIPAFFREFLAEPDEPLVWAYRKEKITVGVNEEGKTPTFNWMLYKQYQQLFSNIVLPPNAGQVAPATPEDNKVIELFDKK